MAIIPVKNLLELFQQMNKEHWPYVWGAARKGCVDCSGAFVYAYNQHGLSIYHGSNRIARRYVVKLIPYAEARATGQIKPGMAAFKARTPGHASYALPSSYTKGGAYYNGDLNDYYHIGLVDDDVNWVLNAQGSKTGFVRSPISQNWSHVALLNAVEYGTKPAPVPKEDDDMKNAKVIGGALFLREKPEKGAGTVMRMENGTKVMVLEQNGEWSKVVVCQPEGYCMTKYLEGID